MENSSGRRVALGLLATVGSLLALQQANLLLKQIQQQDAQAYGITALGAGLLPKGLSETARAAVALWTAPEVVSAATRFVVACTVIDFLLIAAYVWLFAEIMWRFAELYERDGRKEEATAAGYDQPLWRRRGGNPFTRLQPIVWLAVFDALENLARLFAYGSRARPMVGSENVFVWAAWLFEKVKFLLLAVVLFTVVAAVRDYIKPKSRDRSTRSTERLAAPSQQPAAEDRPATVQQVAEALQRPPVRRYATALLVLRAQVVLAVAFAAVLLVDITGQAGDILRRWADGTRSTWLGLVLGIALVGMLAAVLWSSCRRIILADNSRAARGSDAGMGSKRLFQAFPVSLAVAALLWWLLDSKVPWALPILVLIVLLPEVPTWFQRTKFQEHYKRAEEQTDKAAKAPEEPERKAYQATARVLALVPAAALGLGLVRAATGPVILSTLPGAGYELIPFLVVFAGGVLVLWSVPMLAFTLLEQWDRNGVPAALETRHLLLVGVSGILLGALLANPLVVPPLIGSVGVLAIVLSGLGLLFAELQRRSEITVPPRGLTMLGFTRVPVFVLLALWLAVASQLDDGAHHRIRTLEGTPTSTTIGQLWSGWKDANCVATASGPVPLVLVAAEGGGIRAAYWTASVLTDLFGDTRLPNCPGQSARARLFAVSSVSGGSLGAAAYLANPNGTGTWYEQALGEPDYVATPLATGFLIDLPQALLGFRAPDRAAWLERAWERDDAGLDQPYFSSLFPGAGTGGWMPLTILNGTQVETGCRVNTSAVRLATPGGQAPIDCRSITGRKHRLPITQAADGAEAAPAPTQTVPAAPITVDVLDNACGSFAVSTAALLSARFPLISPTGQLPCPGSRVHVVDGGYADGAGMAAVSDLWAQLEPFVAAHNAGVDAGRGLVVPILVHIDNHYQSSAAPAPPPRTPELLAPLRTQQRAAATRDPGREQEAGASFTVTVPGTAGLQCGVDGVTNDTGEVLLAPRTRPGLPAPLAWTLALTSRRDLDNQREQVFEVVGRPLREALTGQRAISCPGLTTTPPNGSGG